jgi:hypothetical protein
MLDSLRRCVPKRTELRRIRRQHATKHHTRTGKQRKAIKFPDMEEDANQAEEETEL